MKTPGPDQQTVTLQGLILPARWGETGDVVGLKMATFDEGEYVIVNDEIGKTLIRYLRRKVIAKGHLMGHTPEKNALKVLSYHLVKLGKAELGQ